MFSTGTKSRETRRSIDKTDKCYPMVPASLVSRYRDTEYTFAWIVATNNRAVDDGLDVYTSFKQLVANGCTCEGDFRRRKRGGFMQIASGMKTVPFSFILSE